MSAELSVLDGLEAPRVPVGRANGAQMPDDLPPFAPIDAYDEQEAAAASSAKASDEHNSEQPSRPGPLRIAPASDLSETDAEPPRDWIIRDLAMAAGRVGTFIGNGGDGKTTIAVQIAVAVATSRALWGMEVKGGAVLGIFCEDEQDEINRKIRAVASAESVAFPDLADLYALSRDGEDNVLCTFDRDKLVPTALYMHLDATIDHYRPRLTIIDTAADVFAGDFVSTPHVRQFLKTALGGLAARYGTAILLLAHPSAAAMSSGDGGGFSVAWNNSVRSRLYLRRPKSDDADEVADRRILEIKKSNYGPTGAGVPLVYDAGRFVLDPNPITEGVAVPKATKVATVQAMAVMEFFHEKAGAGQVLSFGVVFDHLKSVQKISSKGDYEAQRKEVSRTLNALKAEGLITATTTPKGYRITQERGADDT